MRLTQRKVKEVYSMQADQYNTSIQYALHDAAEREKASVRVFRENQILDLLDQPKEVQTDYELMEQHFSEVER